MIKYLFGLMCVLVALTSASFANHDDSFHYNIEPPVGSNVQQGSIKDQAKLAVVDTQGPIQRLIKLFLPNRPAGEGVLSYIQYVINIALSLVAFIAVIVLIYGFYGILFSDSQEGITNAQKTVKGTIIAIIIMGASWLIVQVMFYIITKLQ